MPRGYRLSLVTRATNRQPRVMRGLVGAGGPLQRIIFSFVLTEHKQGVIMLVLQH